MTRKSKSWILAIFCVVMGLTFGQAHVASAATQSPQHQQSALTPQGVLGAAAENALGYCGPPVTSKAGMAKYYMNHSGSAVEQYMRAYAGYYHIQPDQGLANYLQNPHVKYFKAPKGYRIKTNTYCPNGNTVAPYNGRYGVGGVYMLWWCNDTRGYNCVPIAKGYCQNMVTGKMIRPVPKKAPPVKKKPVKPMPAPTPPGSCNVTINGNNNNVINCTTFYVVVTCGGSVIQIPGSTKEEAAANASQYVAQNCSTVNTPSPPSPPPVVVVTPPPPCNCSPPPPPAPKPVPTHSCSIAWLVQKDGRTVQVTVATDNNGPNGTISWGDGSPSSPGLQATHTYGSDSNFTVAASVRFSDNGSANCSTTVTTRAPQVVSQGTTPGPNPADGQPNPDGTPPASGPPNPNGNPPQDNGGTQCPPGYTPDGNGGCN
jgi:hypothetical protein